MSWNAAVPESEYGDADRHEMLDMDDYEYHERAGPRGLGRTLTD